MPVQLTTFVGRERELAAVRGVVAEARMLTLTGSGGCGKTRLALQLATDVLDDYPDGVWFVDLAPVSGGGAVADAVASVLGVRPTPFEPVVETVARELEDRRLLLLLDNCEHVVSACAELADLLLRRCSRLTFVATSREQLGVEGEALWRVPSLSLPDERETGSTTDVLGSSDAVRLFVDRASRARPDFDLTEDNSDPVAEICRRLDGIPLAIELAAARLRLLTPDQIVDGLDNRFRLLTGGARTALPRQRTLEGSVDWGYGLLRDDERAVLRRLSVFAGGFTLEAAEAVCAREPLATEHVLDLLSSLVDKSLVLADGSGRAARYSLLETIRQYAHQKLAESDDESVKARDLHLDFYAGLAERVEPEIEGSDPYPSAELLRREAGNVRSAVEWGAEAGRAEDALRLTSALARYWWLSAQAEGRGQLELALAIPGGPPRLRAKALLGATLASIALWDFGAATSFAEDALAIGRQLDDDGIVGRAYCWLGWAAIGDNSRVWARAHLTKSVEICRRGDDLVSLSAALTGMGALEVQMGDPNEARRLLQESLAVGEQSGNQFTRPYALTYLSLVAQFQGRFEEARRHAEECLPVFRGVGDSVYSVLVLTGLSWCATYEGDYDDAKRWAEKASREAQKTGNPLLNALPRAHLVLVDYAAGAQSSGRAAAEELIPALSAISPVHAAHVSCLLSEIAAREGDTAGAREHIEKARATARDSASTWAMAKVLLGEGRLCRREGDLDRAQQLAHEALAAAWGIDDRATTVDGLELVAGVAADRDTPALAARLLAATDNGRTALGYVRFAPDGELRRADVARTRTSLGDEAFESAWAEGATMSLDEAVAYASRRRGERKRPAAGWASLTPAELKVVNLVAEGLSNPEIAERLFVARSTVKGHVSKILAKLEVSSRAELAAEATRRGITAPP